MYSAFLLLALVIGVHADYQCLCNYHVELEAHSQPDLSSTTTGYMYEFDCKPTFLQGPTIQNWAAIQYEKQVAYVNLDEQVKVQTCPGEPPKDDLVVTTTPMTTKPPTTTTSSTTTPTPTSTSTPTTTTSTSTSTPTTTTSTTTTQSTTTPTTTSTTSTTSTSTATTTSSTTTTTSTVQTTTSTTSRRPTRSTTTSTSTTTSRPVPTTPVPHGDITKCPSHVIRDSQRVDGFVNQYDQYCFVLDPQADTWTNAEKHCTQRGGHLLTIRNAKEQKFFTEYLKSHHYVASIFIGLHDDKTEGSYEWTSGAPVTYTNWDPAHNDPQHAHASSDCVIMKPDGYWNDVYCGLGLIGGVGVFEKHHFICQYGFDAKLPNIVDFLGGLIGR